MTARFHVWQDSILLPFTPVGDAPLTTNDSRITGVVLASPSGSANAFSVCVSARNLFLGAQCERDTGALRHDAGRSR